MSHVRNSARRRAAALIAMGLALAACGAPAAAPPEETTAPPQTPLPDETPTADSPSTPVGQPTATPRPEPTATPSAVEESPDVVEQSADAVQVVTVQIEGGAVTGPERVEVVLGTPLRIEVTSDAADDVHVHGYDIEAALQAGHTEAIEFVADVPGVFEVELHSTHSELFQLRVQ